MDTDTGAVEACPEGAEVVVVGSMGGKEGCNTLNNFKKEREWFGVRDQD